MRILLCGVAAIALSGCSWMGFGQGHKHSSHGDGQYYSKAKSNDGCCVGGQTLSRWNVEGGIGTEFVVSGDAITGSQTHPGFLGPTTTINDVSMNDSYDMGYRAELGGSYAVNPNRKITVQGFYAQADGNDVAWGTQDAAVLRGQMSDYKSYGIEAGVRQYFPPNAIMRPYIEGKLGAAYLDDVRLENIREVVPTDPRTPTSLGLYESGWVPTAAGLIGIETPVFNRFTMGVETGIRYVGKPNSDQTDFVPGTFNARYNGANNGGDRWSVPITIRGRYRF